MKITQEELRKFYEKGETIILNYRKSYHIYYSSNAKRYAFTSEAMPRTLTGLPYTKRGRFHAMTPEAANRIIYT